MTDYLVTFSTRHRRADGSMFGLDAGRIVSDDEFDVDLLTAQGALLVPYRPVLHDRVLAAAKAQGVVGLAFAQLLAAMTRRGAEFTPQVTGLPTVASVGTVRGFYTVVEDIVTLNMQIGITPTGAQTTGFVIGYPEGLEGSNASTTDALGGGSCNASGDPNCVGAVSARVSPNRDMICFFTAANTNLHTCRLTVGYRLA